MATIHTEFQSTPSVWRETAFFNNGTNIKTISIHSLRVEGDQPILSFLALFHVFQSTPSVWRETSFFLAPALWLKEFQSTPSVWRETVYTISSITTAYRFQSTPSVWRETATGTELLFPVEFQSTPSVWRETGLTV